MTGKIRAKQLTLLLAAAFIVLPFGCSKSNQKQMFLVHGRLTFENKPMGGVVIHFVPSDSSDRSLIPNGQTDADGNYTLTTYKTSDGAPAGEYLVALDWTGYKGEAAVPDSMKDEYRAGTSKLRATVKNQPDNTINFALP